MTYASGINSATRSRARRSCPGSVGECMNEIATASTPSAANVSAAARTSPSLERRELVALVVDPAADGQPQVARHERLGRREPVVVGVLARAVAQRERVAEALGHEQTGPRPAVGEHGVRRDRRAVHDQVEPGDEPLQREVQPRGELGEARHEAARGIVGRAARLVDEPHAVADEEEVGERPADVDADPVAHAAAPQAGRRVRVDRAPVGGRARRRSRASRPRVRAGRRAPRRARARDRAGGRRRTRRRRR